MGSHMRCEIAGLRKTLIAYTALKWFFTSVGSNVNIERAGPFKGLVAFYFVKSAVDIYILSN